MVSLVGVRSGDGGPGGREEGPGFLTPPPSHRRWRDQSGVTFTTGGAGVGVKVGQHNLLDKIIPTSDSRNICCHSEIKQICCLFGLLYDQRIYSTEQDT